MKASARGRFSTANFMLGDKEQYFMSEPEPIPEPVRQLKQTGLEKKKIVIEQKKSKYQRS